MGYKIKKIYVGDKQVRPSGWTPGSNTVAYYQFNQNLNDSSGNGYTATSGSTPTYTQDGDGYCFNNTALNNYFTIPNAAKLSGSFTMSMWVKVTQAAEVSYDRDIVGDWDSSNLNIHMYLKKNSNSITFDTGNGSSQSSLTGPNTQYNTRELLTFTRSGTSVKIYMNGTAQASGTGYSGYSTSSSTPFCICRRVPSTASRSTFGGYIDNLILENKVWTDAEVQDYYNQTKANYGL